MQHLIITKQGLPLPHDFSTVMDCMFYWGRSLHGPWYNKTLELFNFYLKSSDLTRVTFTSTHLYCDVIQMRVQQMIVSHFGNSNPWIFDDWLEHYWNAVNTSNCDFFSLAVSSFQYTNMRINEVDSNIDTEAESHDGNVVLPDAVQSRLSHS